MRRVWCVQEICMKSCWKRCYASDMRRSRAIVSRVTATRHWLPNLCNCLRSVTIALPIDVLRRQKPPLENNRSSKRSRKHIICAQKWCRRQRSLAMARNHFPQSPPLVARLLTHFTKWDEAVITLNCFASCRSLLQDISSIRCGF